MRVLILENFELDWYEKLSDRLDKNIIISDGKMEHAPADYEILVAGVPLQKHIEASPQLQTLIIPWAGLPKQTRELMLEYPRIAVHNLHHNARPVAETAITLMLAAAKNIVPIDRALRRQDWSPRYDPDYNSRLITGKRVLILGFGAIGNEIARLCRGFDLTIKAVKRKVSQVVDESVEIYTGDKLPELLPQADILFCSLPHTPETNGILAKEELRLLPDNAIVINIARGRIIDETALYKELASGRIRAGLDVWYEYPQTPETRANQRPSQYDFQKLDNVVMTPHMSEHTTETEDLRIKALADMLNLAGQGQKLPNKVNIADGY